LKHNFFLSGYYKKRGYEDSADLTANRIAQLPQGTPLKAFSFSAKEIFDTRDSAKLKNQRTLNAAGAFLAQNPFGVAVVVASVGMEGDTQKDLLLSEARAMVVREYLVVNFGFDDSQLKTLGMGKQANIAQDAEWGTIQILIYPAGTELPYNKLAAGASSKERADSPPPVLAAPNQKP